MKEKRPVDNIRESGGSAYIGTKEDGAILEMKNIGDRLIIIKEKSIYEFMLADSIDPERTNPDLAPNIQKLLISQGPNSRIISKTFLTAKTLMDTQFIEDGIDAEQAILLTLNLTQEMIVLEKEIAEFIEDEQRISNEYESKRGKPVSYSIPSIENLETRCKTIMQKADHIEQIIIEIISVFYQSEGFNKQSHYPKFQSLLVSKYGEEDPELEQLDRVSEFMQLIRNLRNALDHRLKQVTVKDFELHADSNIISPTIELKSLHGSKLDRISLSEFLPILLENLTLIVERTIVTLSSKNSRSIGIPRTVRLIPKDKRRYEHVEYSFWSPIGDGGYYYQ